MFQKSIYNLPYILLFICLQENEFILIFKLTIIKIKEIKTPVYTILVGACDSAVAIVQTPVESQASTKRNPRRNTA